MKMQVFRKLYHSRWKTHPGYVWAFIMADGETLCFGCVEGNLRSLIEAVAHPGVDDQWRPLTIFNVSESEELETCAHCNNILKEGPDD